jgi:hypothetical protein
MPTKLRNKKEEYEMREPAFDGTVLEGRERRYTIINERDIEKYVPESVKNDLWDAVNAALMFVEEGREKEGKKPYNSYIVINVDEPYVDEIIEVMKRHGHWD